MIGIGVFHSLDYNESFVNPPQASVYRIFSQRIIVDLNGLEMNPLVLKILKTYIMGLMTKKRRFISPNTAFCGYYAFLAVVKFQ